MKTTAIACLILMSLMLGCSEASTDITVKKRLNKSLKGYQDARIVVEHADAQGPGGKSGFGSVAIAFIEGEIFRQVQAIGMRPSFAREGSGLRVSCSFDQSWGLPRVGRHFGLRTTYIAYIDIQFTDESSGEVIGEVAYSRPRFSDNPPNVVVEMFAALLASSER